MLLDYVSRAKPEKKEGVEVAGIVDLAEMVARGLLKGVDPVEARTLSRTLAGRDQLWNEARTFVDPLGKLRRDTGVTYEGKPFPVADDLRSLMQDGQGKTIREYLDGTELGDTLAKDPLGATLMDNTRFAITGLPGNYEAGYTEATMFPVDGGYRVVQPGILAINSNSDPSKHVGYFEHELQHLLQGAFGHSRGTNIDEVDGGRMEYLVGRGQVDPNHIAELDVFSRQNGTNTSYGRYLHTFGEAEARAAERASQHPILQQVAPGADRYTWTSDGTKVNRGLLFEMPSYDEADYNKWWRNKWSKPQ